MEGDIATPVAIVNGGNDKDDGEIRKLLQRVIAAGRFDEMEAGILHKRVPSAGDNRP